MRMEILRKTFEHRDDLIAYVKDLAHWEQGEPSAIIGGRLAATKRLATCDPQNYALTRNYGTGTVSRLSPYIQQGIISLNEVRNTVLATCSDPNQAYKFIQELAWRDYWQRILNAHPEWAWQDIEAYKTGFIASDYADQLPEDIACGKTGIACLDAFIKELILTGYLHNHARMYLASYVIHFRHIKWQAGAKWFLYHLLDGNVASNNFSWQWVASTFSDKPYIFNLENVSRYFGQLVDTSPANNQPLDATYENLNVRLFPLLGNAI